ncbi:MAG TPA: ABC transporter permease [Candidatus Polarisedimenticolia bacterium]|nr:ABC transporter permease [Candidatus Polarisedimenticolia bacterium]
MSFVPADLRMAARALARSPGYAAAAILTLGLGIGACTAIFSAVHAVLVAPLPVSDAEGLVVPVVTDARRGVERGNVSWLDYEDWRRDKELFESVSVFAGQSLDMAGDGQPERIIGLIVSEDYFTVMRAAPALGRSFLPPEHLPGGPRVTVLSDALWRRRFGADPAVVGSTVRLDGEPYTVVGIMPAESVWPGTPEAWTPLQFGPSPPAWVLRRDNCIWQAVARLAPGLPPEQARARLEAMALRVQAENPESKAHSEYAALPLREYMVGRNARRTLLLLLGAVAFVLLIACVNVANLSVARAGSREREMAIRSALGAGRLRLAVQMLSESLLLSAGGGAAGALLAFWGIDLLLAGAPDAVPGLRSAGLNLPVLLFTTFACLAAALLSGAAPALHAGRGSAAESLKEAGPRQSGGRRGARTRAALVLAEVSLSLALLVGAGLMVRSLDRLHHADPGFHPGNLLTAGLSLPDARYPGDEDSSRFLQRAVEHAAALPGVVRAGAASALPLGGGGFYLGRSFLAEGWPEPPAGPSQSGQWSVVTPGYFETLGLRLIEGRLFTEQDTSSSQPVIVLGEKMARQMFPDGKVLGRRIRSWRDENLYREVVGVVGDVRWFDVSDEPRAVAYVPHRQNPWRSMSLVLRTQGDPRSALTQLRASIAALDAELAVADVLTMDEAFSRSIAGARFGSRLLAVFAALALLLAGVGIYGTVSFGVSQRTREIGIRMALGARPRDVMALVTWQGMRPALAGVAAGLLVAWGLSRLMTGLLFAVAPTDPLTYAATTCLLAGAAWLATWIPARRATRVNPLSALRED